MLYGLFTTKQHSLRDLASDQSVQALLLTNIMAENIDNYREPIIAVLIRVLKKKKKNTELSYLLRRIFYFSRTTIFVYFEYAFFFGMHRKQHLVPKTLLQSTCSSAIRQRNVWSLAVFNFQSE